MHDDSVRLRDVEQWASVGTGAMLLALTMSRRRSALTDLGLATASLSLVYRGVTGRWPLAPAAQDTRTWLGGARGIQVRESVRLQLPIADVYRYWRRLENLPTFMRHIERVEEPMPRLSHWVASGPAGVSVEWDAEIINEVENRVLAWRSLPGSDVVTAGSVHFDQVRNGQSTQVTVHLQYAPPAGKAGAAIAALFGREPSQTIREDLRRFKQLLEAGELPRATASQEAP